MSHSDSYIVENTALLHPFSLLFLFSFQFISFDDQHFLFEAVANIIVVDGVDAADQASYMTSIIMPLLTSFSQILDRVCAMARAV